ncbi:hypothetical protein SSX86_029037 [Deinandra increscens subsp. villosa]|uniref:DNA (cytosine-5-)-methyltransferase n=1 Tax=Deinandra increscens subsp. villosa TaxID=3103831 RepID=A0AAP0GJS7_9ASTR
MDAQSVSAVQAWKHSEFLCKNYVLNGLADSLYNVYCKVNTAKELWESLERKYKTEDAGTKKFVVAKFLDFKMIDSKTVMSQIQELQIILHDIHAEGMSLSETFQVAAMIEKLPPSWVDFKNYLKHKRKEMTVEDLVVRLRIEEDNKLAQKKSDVPEQAKANIVEYGQSSKGNKNRGRAEKKNKGKGFNLKPKGGVAKKKFDGKCYNCDKPGHRANECRQPKKDVSRQANMVDDYENLVAMISDLTMMISEVNLVGSNTKEWWVDTGATRHVCADKNLFNTFKEVTNGEKLFMGNSATAEVKGEGNVILKMTSGKELTLTNVLYVPEIRKNLVSGWLLNKFGFKMVFESDKVVLTKNSVYVGKGYALNGMLELNVMVVNNAMNKTGTSSAYLLESSNVWHGRLGHDGNASGEDYENIDWDTEDELEIENIAPSSCSNVVARNVEAIVSNGEASSSAGPSNSNLVQQFLGMGFPEEMIAKAIKENGEANTDAILESLLTYGALALEESPDELNSCHHSSPQQQQFVDNGQLSSDYDESVLADLSDSDDSWSGSEVAETSNSLPKHEKAILSLANMGYTIEEASAAIDRCGPEASIAELTDFICAAQMAKTEAVFFEEEKPKISLNGDIKKRKLYELEMWKRKKRKGLVTEDDEAIRLPNPMIGFGTPTDGCVVTHRTLPEAALGPPFFYYENVALAPKGVWDTISRFLYDVEPEFVDSKYFCAAARKRGYVHNLPIKNRFPIFPLPPRTINDALPLTKRWWPAWDKRTKLNCLQTVIGSAKLTERIRKALEKWGDDPPLHVQKYVMDECRKWNLVWVGKNKLAPLEPDEVEMLLGFPRNHTRGGGISRTDRYKSLGNSFQVDTVAYHLSVLKDLFPNGINMLSLFSGIGGAEVALHRLQIPLKNVVSVEISAANRDIVRSWWEQTNQTGNLIHLADVQQLNGDRLEELMGSFGGFDLVLGGSPCNNLAGSNRDGNASGEDYENIDWDTEDELEIENIAPSSCSNVVARNVEAIVSNGEASSSAGPSNSNLVQQFLGMGFPEEMIAKAIKENGEANTDAILESLLTYGALALEESPDELNSCHHSSPQQQQFVDNGQLSSDYDESVLADLSDSDDSWSGSEVAETSNSLPKHEKAILSLANMGYTIEEASAAIDRCGPEASIAELTDFICAAQMAKTEAVFFEEEKPKISLNGDIKKRKLYELEMWKRKKRKGLVTEDDEAIRLPNPMIGFGTPTDGCVVTHRTLPEAALGPPFFYYENVALAPKGVWDTISRFLYDVEPEFVDSKYFCAAARKRGYVHNLPIKNRFPIFPLPPRTINDALPLTKRWWPAWDKRTKLNCLQTYVMDECRKWNLVWVGKNKLAPLEPDEVEMLLGFPRNHTRGGGISRTDRYKSLGNSFQVDTVAYHLSVLKDLFPNGINMLSLFSGIGGAEVALHRLQIPLKNVVSVEISAANRDIVRSWWEQTNQTGNLIHLADVQQLNGDRLEELMGSFGGFDLVLGGSPCNNLAGSNRVSRDGLEGEHSSLFYDYFRILDLVKCIMNKQQ